MELLSFFESSSGFWYTKKLLCLGLHVSPRTLCLYPLKKGSFYIIGRQTSGLFCSSLYIFNFWVGNTGVNSNVKLWQKIECLLWTTPYSNLFKKRNPWPRKATFYNTSHSATIGTALFLEFSVESANHHTVSSWWVFIHSISLLFPPFFISYFCSSANLVYLSTFFPKYGGWKSPNIYTVVKVY